jgi:hypothetical protein
MLAELEPHLERGFWLCGRSWRAHSKADPFLESGIAFVANVPRDHAMEVGLVGQDGMTGLPIVLDTGRAPHGT